MRNGMQYDPIQYHGHCSFEVGILLCHLQWKLATDHRFLN